MYALTLTLKNKKRKKKSFMRLLTVNCILNHKSISLLIVICSSTLLLGDKGQEMERCSCFL